MIKCEHPGCEADGIQLEGCSGEVVYLCQEHALFYGYEQQVDWLDSKEAPASPPVRPEGGVR